jgi:hypothetical protein
MVGRQIRAYLIIQQQLRTRGKAAENGRLWRCFRRRSHTPVHGVSPAALNALAATLSHQTYKYLALN